MRSRTSRHRCRSYGSLTCTHVSYLGTDGSTYYSNAAIDSSGWLVGSVDAAGTGAAQHECDTSYYPYLSTGPGHGPRGHWNAMLAICVPN
jgi:hypothetical protein